MTGNEQVDLVAAASAALCDDECGHCAAAIQRFGYRFKPRALLARLAEVEAERDEWKRTDEAVEADVEWRDDWADKIAEKYVPDSYDCDEGLWAILGRWIADTVAQRDNLAAENARLRQERDELRRVVRRVLDRHATIHTLCDADEYELSRAYRAGQNTPASPPGSTLPREDGEVEGPATDTAQAERGVAAILAGRWCQSPGPGDQPCEGYEGHPGEHWRVDHTNETLHSWTDEPAPPPDPPGLDAAVLAMRRARNIDPTDMPAMARAAAPALRAGALREFADEIEARAENWPLAYRPEQIIAALRERADRIGGAT